MTDAPKADPDPTVSSSRWGRAIGATGAERKDALHDLAASYWYCVYAWWRRMGLDGAPAATATVGSFTRWLGDFPPSASDSGAARMREWLPARLAELAQQGAELDGPAAMAIDPGWAERRYADEPAGEPDAIFHRRWALTVIEFTASTLRLEYAARGDETLFEELLAFAGFERGDDERYAAVGARLGRTAGAIHKAVFDFRTRQREVLRSLVADTVLDPADADSEITALLCACDAPGSDAAGAPLPSAIRTLHPDEILTRAIQSVHMTGFANAGGWQPPTVEEAARLFPQYEVLSLLGRGGMGAVYQARQIELDRLVAIKLLPLEISVDRSFAERFRREARAMARLNHPNIIAVHDFGTTTEGHLFFAMEFVEGANLHQMIHGPGISPAQALEIIGRVCDALAYAHSEGVVHRDIKPANVMMSLKGHVKVADFGLARLNSSTAEPLGHTVTGTVMGTPDYMAPEQMRGMNVDHRADIYSLGVMLYEMLCREVPHGIFDPPSQRVAVDSRVDQVVIKAMQQQPDRRYQSTQEMKADVDAASAPQPLAIAPKRGALARLPLGGLSRAMTMPPHAAAPDAKKKRPIFAGVAVLAIIAALLFIQPWKKKPAPEPPPSPASGQTAATTKQPSVSPFGPWQPLFTDAEWKETVPRKGEIVDGRLHLFKDGRVAKPQPSSDGAMRARLRFQQGSIYVGFEARKTKNGALFKAQLHSEKSVVLNYYPRYGDDPEELGRYWLPKPLQPGDTLLLELRLQGDRLTVLVDGAVVIKAQDARLPDPGEWGIIAKDGWFESVEVQTPLPAAAAVLTFAGHRYQIVSGAWSWEQARQQATQAGGHLATVTSADEDRFLRAALDRLHPTGDVIRYWIGAHSPKGDGTFVWMTGEPFAFTAWGGPEPDLHLKQPGKPGYVFYARDSHYDLPAFAWADAPADSRNLVGYLVEWDDAGNASAPPSAQVSQSSSSAAATKDAPFVNTLGMKFVPVPIVGGPTAGKTVLFSVWETRVQDYAAFATETKRDWRKANFEQGPTHPAVLVSWDDATAFCAWLTERERKAGRLGPDDVVRLPKDHEWSCAVGIGDREDGTKLPGEKKGKIGDVYPWGTAWPPPPGAGNYGGTEVQPLIDSGAKSRGEFVLRDYTDDFPWTAPVGSFAANALGIYDLGGNVWEWCEEAKATQTERFLRGACYLPVPRVDMLSSRRVSGSPAVGNLHFGFRCVLEVAAPAAAATAPDGR